MFTREGFSPWPEGYPSVPRAKGGLRLPAPRVRLEALDRPLDRPLVVPAEDRAEHRGEDAEQRPVGDHPPVEVDVDLPVPGREGPDALAGEVADHADLELVRAL